LGRRRVIHVRKRKPTYEGGRIILVTTPVYLDRQVADKPPKGLSHVSEVRGILKEMDEDLKHGVSPKTIHSRSRILFLAILRSSKLSKDEKKKAIKYLNDWREKHGWKPFELQKPL